MMSFKKEKKRKENCKKVFSYLINRYSFSKKKKKKKKSLFNIHCSQRSKQSLTIAYPED